METKNARYEIFKKNEDTYGLIIFKSDLAKKINRFLGKPYDVTAFEDGEEPVFTVSKNLIGVIRKKLEK